MLFHRFNGSLNCNVTLYKMSLAIPCHTQILLVSFLWVVFEEECFIRFSNIVKWFEVITKFKKFQRRAPPFMKYSYDNTLETSSYLPHGLHWMSLQIQPKMSSLTMICKAVNNQTALVLEPQVTRQERLLRQFRS